MRGHHEGGNMKTDRTSSPGGLEGLRVLEAGDGERLAFLGQLFADHGAQVIRLTAPASRAQPLTRRAAVRHRNKAHATLAPGTRDGRDLMLSLVRRADFFLTDRLFADPRDYPEKLLMRENAGLILVDAADEDRPAEDGMPTALLAATYAFSAALIALQHRHQSGHGQTVTARAARVAAFLHDVPAEGTPDGWRVFTHPLLGETPMPDIVPTLARSPGKLWRPAEAPGTDNAAVYLGLLGLAQEELERLEKTGII